MAALTYSDYLHLDTLLSLQVPHAPDTADPALVLAEHLFIVAHQSCELWLKQVVVDLAAAADALSPMTGVIDAELSAEILQRVSELLRVLHDQLVALERLPLRHFAEFRPYLETASGAQSSQFRTLTDLLGDDRRPGRLYEAFRAATAHSGLSVTEVCRSGIRAGVYHRIAESLLDVGNGYWRWKIAHLSLLSRMLGDLPGTGGTSGVAHLVRRTSMPFPELRRLRGEVHDDLAPAREA
ncbi:tryptophan 2,3-dioxygenase family protein [Microbispora sp. NPDC004025]